MPGVVEPDRIQSRSFEIIAELLRGFNQSAPEWPIVRRVVHATGDPAIAGLLRIHPMAVQAGLAALRGGRPIIADVRMVEAGIDRGLAATMGCELLCAVDEPSAMETARKLHVTRSAAALIQLSARIPGAIVAIGNAPTALFALLEMLEAGSGAPALVVGVPVGFVGAAEAKAELMRWGRRGPPYICVEGSRGGSSIAAAVVNALLHMACDGVRTRLKEGGE